MRVLVIESQDRDAETAVEALVDAGHHVSFCHEPGAGALDCNGMPGRAGCPLDHGAVDVAVLGRSGPVGSGWGPSAEPTAREAGVGCARRHRVPVVITSTVASHTPPSWAADVVDPADPDLVSRVATAAEQGRVPLVEATEAATRAVLDGAGLASAPAVARVEREERRLRIEVDVAAELDHRLREAIGVRVVGAIRTLDWATPSIDVHVIGTTAQTQVSPVH
jgi:hypothetical protein